MPSLPMHTIIPILILILIRYVDATKTESDRANKAFVLIVGIITIIFSTMILLCLVVSMTQQRKKKQLVLPISTESSST